MTALLLAVLLGSFTVDVDGDLSVCQQAVYWLSPLSFQFDDCDTSPQSVLSCAVSVYDPSQRLFQFTGCGPETVFSDGFE